jgi:hypothetical protein
VSPQAEGYFIVGVSFFRQDSEGLKRSNKIEVTMSLPTSFC